MVRSIRVIGRNGISKPLYCFLFSIYPPEPTPMTPRKTPRGSDAEEG